MHLILTWGSIAIDGAGSGVLAKLRLPNKSVSDRGEQNGWTELELSGEGGCAQLSCHGHLACTVYTQVQCKNDDKQEDDLWRGGRVIGQECLPDTKYQASTWLGQQPA